MRSRGKRGGEADLVELEPLVVGRVEDALDFGLALGGEGRVGEDEVEAGRDLGGPLPHDLLPHDLAAGPEAVQAQEPRPPGAHPAAEAAHPPANCLFRRGGREGVCGGRWREEERNAACRVVVVPCRVGWLSFLLCSLGLACTAWTLDLDGDGVVGRTAGGWRREWCPRPARTSGDVWQPGGVGVQKKREGAQMIRSLTRSRRGTHASAWFWKLFPPGHICLNAYRNEHITHGF